MTQHHLTIGGTPWCEWTGCKAGQDINAKAGPHTCGQPTATAAKRAAKDLRPHFRRGAVKAVAGPCPQDVRA